MTVKKKKNPHILISIFDFLYEISFVLLSGFKLWHQDFLKPYFPISPLHDIIGIKKKKKSQFCMDRIGSSESSVMRYRKRHTAWKRNRFFPKKATILATRCLFRWQQSQQSHPEKSFTAIHSSLKEEKPAGRRSSLGFIQREARRWCWELPTTQPDWQRERWSCAQREGSEYYHSEWPHLSSGGSIFLTALK